MKKIQKKYLSIMLLVVFMSVETVTANASSQKTVLAEEVFSQEELEKIEEEIEEIDVAPLYMDKNKNGEFKINRTRSTGTYPTRAGVILVTNDAYKNLIPTGHAAIVYSSNRVIEALAKGVTVGKNNWYTSKKTCFAVTVKGTTVAQDKAAAKWCYKQIGKDYNYNYLNVNTRKRFYCSQLVWAAFKDNYKIDLNTKAFGNAIHPTELILTSKTHTIYRK